MSLKRCTAAMRSSGDIRGHSPSSKAVRAAATARSMSAVVPSGTRPTTSSVCGEMTSMTSEPAGATHSPPMKSLSWTCMVFSCVERVVVVRFRLRSRRGRPCRPTGSRACRWGSAPPRRRGGARGAPCTRQRSHGSGPSRSSSVGVRPVAGLDHGGDPLAPAVVGHADDDGVEDGGVGLERGLDLLGEDLLAAGVDALRAAAEQGDRAVGLEDGHVAGQRVAVAVGADDERLGRLLSVLVVGDGHVAAAGQPALPPAAGLRSR